MDLHRIRRNLPRSTRALAALFVVLWATVIATPCVMAMQADPPKMAMHDCPHCPPQPCDAQVGTPDCDTAEPADRSRSIDPSQQLLALPSESPEVEAGWALQREGPPTRSTQARAGPRPHLVHVRFNE